MRILFSEGTINFGGLRQGQVFTTVGDAGMCYMKIPRGQTDPLDPPEGPSDWNAVRLDDGVLAIIEEHVQVVLYGDATLVLMP